MKMYEATVLICDGSPDATGDIFDAQTEMKFHVSVVVTENFDVSKPIGTAVLSQGKGALTAQISIDDLYEVTGKIPAVNGRILKMRLEGGDRLRRIESVEIISIGLGQSNIDPRIKPISA